MLILGIDPGVGGGLAWLKGTELQTAKMPEEPEQLAELIRHHPWGKPALAVLEKQWARPAVEKAEELGKDKRQFRGSVSNAKLLQNFGECRAVLATLGIDRIEPAPIKWQNALGCRFGKAERPKRELQLFAQSLYPEAKIIQQVADAVLLADYGKRICWHESLKKRQAG